MTLRVGLVSCLAACSAAADDSGATASAGGGGSDSTTTSTTAAGGAGGSTAMGGFDAGTGGGFDCVAAAKLVYVVGSGNQLYSFEPSTLAFTQIGYLDCKSNGAHPFSMGVDHNAVAWVLYDDGKIYNVSTSTAKCTPTNYVAGQQGFLTFGMGFGRDTPNGETEKLYVADMASKGLGIVDTTTLTLSVVGPFDKETLGGELTGTGDARLFGFFGESLPMKPMPPQISEIDKTTGTILSQTPLPTIDMGTGWAFAFWGGYFWLFTSPFGHSQVDRFDPVSNKTLTVLPDAGFTIVGAGVSTCAPLEPPT